MDFVPIVPSLLTALDHCCQNELSWTIFSTTYLCFPNK